MRIDKFRVWVKDDIIGRWFKYVPSKKTEELSKAFIKVQKAHINQTLIDAEELVEREDRASDPRMNKKIFDIEPKLLLKKYVKGGGR